uniref:Uncharacterized protein n=1 Tax=Trichogramma kaykai TaxID=54128 RepID=A0ABD2XAE4_9HYME
MSFGAASLSFVIQQRRASGASSRVNAQRRANRFPFCIYARKDAAYLREHGCTLADVLRSVSARRETALSQRPHARVLYKAGSASARMCGLCAYSGPD